MRTDNPDELRRECYRLSGELQDKDWRLEVEIHRNAVACEVLRHAMSRKDASGMQILSGILACMDHSLNWWSSGTTWSLDDWIEYLTRGAA